MGEQFIFAPTPALARFCLTQISSIKSIATPKKKNKMWEPGDIVVWRAIFRQRIWTARAIIAVKDTPEEIVLVLLPGAECRTEKDYAKGKKDGKRRWDFKNEAWQLTPYTWQTNRLLLFLEPENFYSTIFLWNQVRSEFVGYYINFQLPFKRSHCGIDTLDLELDIDIHPDFSLEWKDLDDYEKGIETGIILPEWVAEIERAKVEVLNRLEKRQYPFNGAWLDWMPDPSWSPPTLPADWDKI